jgi:predicted DNA-binding protein (UPF0251 family)
LTKTSTNDARLEDYISQAEAARIRGVSKQAIADLIKRGRLSKATIAGRSLVLQSEVMAFVPKPKMGRPPKKGSKRAAKRSKAKK